MAGSPCALAGGAGGDGEGIPSPSRQRSRQTNLQSTLVQKHVRSSNELETGAVIQRITQKET